MKILPISAAHAPSEIGLVAERRLHESPYFFLKNLHCRYDQGVLTLLGRVPLPRLKQVAESIVVRVQGVEEVVNRIEVVDPTEPPLTAREVRNAG
jgi:osmotically-inducible protein OsmY